jgi:hypothetical protein
MAQTSLVRWDNVMDALRVLDRAAVDRRMTRGPKLSAYKSSPWLALCS